MAVSRFGAESVKVVKNHAKIARLWNDSTKLLIRGSMNLNWNPRFEQLDVTEGGEDFELVARIEDELPTLPRKYSNADVETASGLSKAFERSQLDMFKSLKPWQP